MKKNKISYTEIETQEELKQLLSSSIYIKNKAFQDLDFTHSDLLKYKNSYENCLFLGCTLPENLINTRLEDSLIFPKIKIPFNVYRSTLYTKDSLYEGYELGNIDSYKNTFDKKVYDHYIANGKEAKDIKETLARRLHDFSISNALYNFLDNYPEKKVVAIMGGHQLGRNEKTYKDIAKISKTLTEEGYLMISGGGPGAMEATHVGAWMAGRNDKDLQKVINLLSEAPIYTDALWLDKAFSAIALYPETQYQSLGIPTWLYGHEPPTPFATDIAKYFANSVREDGLLSIAKGGIIFSPGSAGTIQEIFQEATQNHYLSYDYASPMVFMDSKYWTEERAIYPLLTKMMKEGKYKNLLLSKYDQWLDIVNEILKFTV